MALSLQEVVDLEARLEADREGDPAALAQRDAALGLDRQASDLALLREWVAVEGGLGRRVVGAARLLRSALLLCGVLIGWGVATGLLAYDGKAPVSVLGWLGVAVCAQVLLLSFTLLGLAVWRLAPTFYERVGLWQDLRGLVGWGLRRLVARVETSDLQRLHRLRSRGLLYRAQEAWLGLELLQGFALAFNLGLLARLLQQVVFSDIAFGWGTTLEMAPATFHGVVEVLALPFGWVASTTPSAELVEATRFTRMGASFASPAGVQLAGGWWPFLCAITLTYGLLPRLLLWIYAARGRVRSLANLPLDTPELQRVLRRLRTPMLLTEAPDREDDGRLPEVAAAPAVALEAKAAFGLRWGALEDRDEALVEAIRAMGAGVDTLAAAGGADYAADLAHLESLQAEPPPQVLLVAEGFDEPDRALRRYLTQIRARVGAAVPLVVLLIEAELEDLQRWRAMLAGLADPYLDVQLLERAS